MGGILQVDTIKNNNASTIITQTNTTTLTFGSSGQTIVIPSGTTFNASSASVNLPSISLTTGVTGTLPIANGGTNLTTYTTGDLLYASNATTLTKLAIGTSGQGLVVSGGVPAWGTSGPSAGQVIQVLSATDSTGRNTTSTSFVTASNTLSVTITPSATANKILILTSVNMSAADNGQVTIYRGATDLGSNGLGFGYVGPNNIFIAASYLDSPNTTSATTYQFYMKTNTPGYAIYFNGNSGAQARCTLTCLEIKG